MPWWSWIPIAVLAVLALVLGVLVLLGRWRGGRHLRPLIMFLSKVPLFKRWFQKASLTALERSNPELARAMKKMQAFGEPRTPEQAQVMLNTLNPSERRAYFQAVEEEGSMPEPTNRQQRRRMEQGGMGLPARTPSPRPGAAGRRSGSKNRKKR